MLPWLTSTCCLWRSINAPGTILPPLMMLHPELEAALIAVTHIRQRSKPLLILAVIPLLPCLCVAVALFPSAHCSSQRARLPVNLPRAPSWFTASSVCVWVHCTLYKIISYVIPVIDPDSLVSIQCRHPPYTMPVSLSGINKPWLAYRDRNSLHSNTRCILGQQHCGVERWEEWRANLGRGVWRADCMRSMLLRCDLCTALPLCHLLRLLVVRPSMKWICWKAQRLLSIRLY